MVDWLGLFENVRGFELIPVKVDEEVGVKSLNEKVDLGDFAIDVLEELQVFIVV